MKEGRGLSTRFAAALSLALLLPALPARAAALRVGDATLAVRSAGEWDRENAGDPEIPRTAAGVLRLAREVWPPLRPAGEPGEPGVVVPEVEPLPGADPGERCNPAPALAGPHGGCGTPDLDRVYRALANPRLDPRVVRAVQRIAAAGRPPLEKEHTTEHFYFRYTTLNADPLQNVTAAAVRDLGRNLEEDYAAYAAVFAAPRNTTTRINVYVFHPGAVSWFARTSFYTNSIEFNSRWAKESCRRKVDAAHELFHRVQYVSRAKRPDWNGWEKWWTEGTAKWAEELRRPAVNDWTGWGSQPLSDPNAKAFFARSYDTVLWWVYLSQRKRLAGGDWNAPVARVLRSYEAGKQGPALAEEVAKIGLKASFADALVEWYTANYLKDSVSPDPKYLYDDNNAAPLAPCEGGPLKKVAMKYTTDGVDASSGGSSGWLLVNQGGALYESMTFAPGTDDIVGISFRSDPATNLADGEGRFTVITEQGGVLKSLFTTSKVPFVYNVAPKSMGIDKAVAIYESPLKSAYVLLETNPQLFNGYWTVEETWDATGYTFWTAWEIRGDTGVDPSVLKVEAVTCIDDGAGSCDEVIHNVDGTGHVDTMRVTYPCFACTNGGEYTFIGVATPGTNFREITGDFDFTYTDPEGNPATGTGTWKATRAGW